MRSAKEAGVNYRVSTTLHKLNSGALRELLKEYGSKLSVGGILSTGRGKDVSSTILSSREYGAAVVGAGARSAQGTAGFVEGCRMRPNTHCGAGLSIISIDEVGNVFPCQILISQELSGGNIRSQSLETILRGEIWGPLRQSEVQFGGKCRTCFARNICGGGCRAKTYYDRGIFNESDGLCQLYTTSILGGLFDTGSDPASPGVFGLEE